MGNLIDFFLDNQLDLPYNQVDLPLLLFFMLFSCGIAIFHTVIFSTLFELKFNAWLFFLLNPLLLLISFSIYKALVFPMFFLLFISVFVLAIIGMVRFGIKSSIQNKKKAKRFRKKYKIKPTPKWKRTLGIVFTLLFISAFLWFGPFVFLLLFLIKPLSILLLPNNKHRFLKYQATLPTATIRSVAMGLAEIKGTLEMIQPLIAPIGKKVCIGFRYRIESIHTKDGEESYSTVFDETTCNPFFIKDETGKIEVNPNQIEFVYVPEDGQYSSSGKRYTQFLLKANDEMLLIGKANVKASNQPVFEYEKIKKVFAIAPVARVRYYNTYKPLLNSFIIFTSVFAFIASLILISPVHIEDKQLVIEAPEFISIFNQELKFRTPYLEGLSDNKYTVKPRLTLGFTVYLSY